MVNPFKPTAGKMPPVLIGRQDIVDDFAEGLDNGAGAPGRLMLVSGQRGLGKTVMLTELARTAIARGWEAYAETASAGMTDRLIAALDSAGPRVRHATIAPAIGIPGIANVQLGSVDVAASNTALDLRRAIESRLKKLPKGKGILFTVDEAQAAKIDELVAIATALQHVTVDQDLTDERDEEKRGVAFAFAALPSIVDELASNEVLTFLRRATYRELGNVAVPDVRNAFVETITAQGKSISRENAETAARATIGNPYLVQLVGYYMWQAAQARHSDAIEAQDVEYGIADALSQFPEAVCAPSYRSLSPAQQHFLRAMAPDYPSATTLSDIAERTGKSMSWVGKYRMSLERVMMIRAADWGMVEYAQPYFGEWIRSRM
ncbi:MAG: ATP-binding protein [Eggerthellaceae bacterium]|nr:ATP-binding protein [Eggerthellaceae bacterium]